MPTRTSAPTRAGRGFRLERDPLGDVRVPAAAYYGVQTARALENFHISGVELRLYPDFIRALAMVKLAAARANFETGGFSKEILDAIDAARESLRIKMFEFSDPSVMKAVTGAHQRGVNVRIMLNPARRSGEAENEETRKQLGDAGIEVLLSRRADGTDYTSGAWVFPGGIVDARDRDAHAACFGIDDAAASTRLGLGVGGLDFFIAAIRECFEESGLLFGRAVGDRDDALDGDAADRLAPWRGALHRREHGIAEMCAQEGIRLDAGALVYLSHWLTPLGRPKRFDTRFFIAAVPTAQTAAHDGAELGGRQVALAHPVRHPGIGDGRGPDSDGGGGRVQLGSGQRGASRQDDLELQ